MGEKGGGIGEVGKRRGGEKERWGKWWTVNEANQSLDHSIMKKCYCATRTGR